ncbi:class I SAM-dependent methyltransferase [Streptomyces sp. NBC_00859]|uniref:class I SAM-dependent methyltransferase n=1 Tax=Streptomyces sp. NBC_00859 TaxID=2903682 RepID=UPI0038645FA5|nr:class I SAM-dependent methyltransferase [Streptomyces sp. NBC_00859]WSZ86788.1 class I SAM-dependent methyltransferase [Streptomyces sp. NBC_00859]
MSLQQDWEEQDSSEFIEFGEYFVPERQTQIDVVTSLIPEQQAPFEILDLCCGQGRLSEGLIKAFPQATVVGMDLSPTMLGVARRELSAYEKQFRTEQFDLAEKAWRTRDEAPAAVVSSLAVHHLDGEGKQELFGDVFEMLRPGGVLVIADLIQPVGERGVALTRRMWNEAVKEQGLAGTGSLEPYEKFHTLEWSCYEYPDDLDKPSPIFDQLSWLRDAGFSEVDVHWLKAGHAIYGGLKPGK